MSYTRWMVLGLVAVIALTLMPLTLVGRGGAHHARVARLLGIERLNGHLVYESLRLRLGMSGSYDNIATTIDQLRLRSEALLSELSGSDLAEDAVLVQRLSASAHQFARIEEQLERFPTYNASVLSAVASLSRALEDLAARGEESWAQDGWTLAALERECRRALVLQARWDPLEAASALADYRQRTEGKPVPDDDLRVLLRSLELALEHRLLADELLGGIHEASRQAGLFDAINRYVAASERREMGDRDRALMIQGLCFGLAIAICSLLCFAGWVQTRQLSREVEERRRLDAQAREIELQLRHAQKMEAIGQLAAGIAHEINTPTQYVGDNARFLQESFEDIGRVLDTSEQLVAAARAGQLDDEALDRFDRLLEELDVDFLREEIPQTLDQSLDGIGRIAQIVRSMKEFSHPGSGRKTEVDLNRAIESTVTVCRNEWRYVADVELRLDPALPPVLCLPGEVNQALLNVIVNAAHAVEDALEAGRRQQEAGGAMAREKGRIVISTAVRGDEVEVRVTDTGTGMPEEVRERIFDPFFTTKEVGRGTGQGLAIAHAVITQKHSGSIEVESTSEGGTTFVIRLPIGESQLARV